MTETPDPTQPLTPAAPQSGEAQPPAPTVSEPAAVAPPAYGSPPQFTHANPVGKVRSTGICILLIFVTLGFYTLYWFYATHAELKKNTGQGLGGGVALVLAILVGFVMPYITSHEVGAARQLRLQEQKVSAATGLWYFPGLLILIGPFVWFIKTNGALNDYWKAMGAPAN